MHPVPVGISLLGVVRLSRALALTTPPLAVPTADPLLVQRATTAFSTCGYVDGDPSRPRIAPPGFNCRVDTVNGLWGFCPTSVLAASDCGLGGFCFDGGPCSTGCGRASLRNNPKITTWTCPELDDAPNARFCTAESLIFGPDQTFDYVDCAANPGKQILFFSPTTPAPKSSASTSALTLPANPTTAAPSSTVLTAQVSSQTTSVVSPTTGSNASTPEQDRGGSSTPNTGAIIGGSLGGLALLLGFGVTIVYLLRNNWGRHSDRAGPGADTASQDNTASSDAIAKAQWPGWERRELPAERLPGGLPGYNPGITSGHVAELPAESR